MSSLKFLCVEILKTESMKDVVECALLQNVDIEEILEFNFTSLKLELQIGDAKWDRVVKPLLNVLNELLGLRIVLNGKFYTRKFNEFSSKYIVYSKTHDGKAGSWFSSRQSLDMDFENENYRKGMTWKMIDGHDFYVSHQLVGVDAVNIPNSRVHKKLTNVQRCNLSSPSISQKSRWWCGEACYEDCDNNEKQTVFLKTKYDESHELQENYKDPLTGKHIKPIVNFVGDHPAICALTGAPKSGRVKYGNPFADKVTLGDLKKENNQI